MPANTEVIDGLHILKLTGLQGGIRVQIPTAVREQLQLRPGLYVTLRCIGPCVVVSLAKDITPEGVREDSDAAFKKAIREFEKARG
jgi:hypothetical protein